MTLKKKVKERLQAQQNLQDANYTASGIRIPQYDEFGRVLNPEKKQIKPLNAAGLATLAVIAIVLVSIYIPQIFIPDYIVDEKIADSDPSQYAAMEAFVRAHGTEDFDSDGMDNRSEMDANSNPFVADTDLDGVIDGRDSHPLKGSTDVYRAILDAGQSIKTPYAVNGVILWPSNENSWVQGAVVETMLGYRFCNFVGWAKFPSGKYAYKYEDGRHTMLDYRDDAGAWRIEEDCLVVLSEKAMPTTNKISIFGFSAYIRGGFGDFLSSLLPDKGWLTCVNMWVEDTFIDTSLNTYTEFNQYDPRDAAEERFSSYSKSLVNLAEVYSLVSQDYHVIATLMSPKGGECILEIIGYTHDGNLIAVNPQNAGHKGIITITPSGIRSVGEDNLLAQYSYFEFYGCGYNSADGDMIGFFAAEKYDSNAMDSLQEPAAETMPTETIAEPTAETMSIETTEVDPSEICDSAENVSSETQAEEDTVPES